MHSPQDLIEDVRFERVVENVYVRIWLDLLQHKKQSLACLHVHINGCTLITAALTACNQSEDTFDLVTSKLQSMLSALFSSNRALTLRYL